MIDEEAVKGRVSAAILGWMAYVRTNKAALATETGMSRQTLDDILDGKRLISTASAIKLAAHFGTSPGALLNGVLPPSTIVIGDLEGRLQLVEDRAREVPGLARDMDLLLEILDRRLAVEGGRLSVRAELESLRGPEAAGPL